MSNTIKLILITIIINLLLSITAFSEESKTEQIHTPLGCSSPLSGEYFVRLNAGSGSTVPGRAQSMINLYGGVLENVYDNDSLLSHGFYVSNANATNMTDMLNNESDVIGVEQACLGEVTGVQQNVSWNLDRMDQTQLPLDDEYDFPVTGSSNVHVYVLDTWITGATSYTTPGGLFIPANPHNELAGKISESDSMDFIPFVSTTNPGCFNHGTPVAGVIAGSSLGIARDVTLHSFRVADCQTGAQVFPGAVVAAINQILDELSTLDGPAIVNMSFCSDSGSMLNSSIQSLINAGVTVVASAGNTSIPSCGQIDDFQRINDVISVGGTGGGIINGNNEPTSPDSVWNGSTLGSFIDIFAPALNVEVPSFTSTASTELIDGTSFAAPHVTGAAAVYLSYNPTASPSTVLTQISNNATTGQITGLGAGDGPNSLLNTCFLDSSCSGPSGPIEVSSVDLACSQDFGIQINLENIPDLSQAQLESRFEMGVETVTGFAISTGAQTLVVTNPTTREGYIRWCISGNQFPELTRRWDITNTGAAFSGFNVFLLDNSVEISGPDFVLRPAPGSGPVEQPVFVAYSETCDIHETEVNVFRSTDSRITHYEYYLSTDATVTTSDTLVYTASEPTNTSDSFDIDIDNFSAVPSSNGSYFGVRACSSSACSVIVSGENPISSC